MGNSIKKICMRIFSKKEGVTEPLLQCISFPTTPNTSKKNSFKNVGLEDFKVIRTLGRGSFGKVVMVQYKDSQSYYAMKILKKDLVKQTNQIFHTKTEREILEKISHPFIVRLQYAFQSPEKLYIVTDFMQGGELFYHLRKEGYFNDLKTKFYICEIILAIEHLHKQNIIYRDLKPENILLDSDGHIKLTDFGLSKIVLEYSDPNSRTYTICGTPEYLAPEILSGSGYDKNVDWWSLGAVMYEMYVGYSPYKENKYKLDLENYLRPIPHHKNLSIKAYDLINNLLQNHVSRRLGTLKDAEEVKQHEYFSGINWKNILEKKVKPPFKPMIRSKADVSNFDRMFTEEDPNSSKGSLFPTHNKNDVYENFTFVRNELK
jgi:serine/threonine protein kinase